MIEYLLIGTLVTIGTVYFADDYLSKDNLGIVLQIAVLILTWPIFIAFVAFRSLGE